MSTVKVHWEELEDLTELDSKIIDQRRWVTVYVIIAQHDEHGPIMYNVERGSTEHQEMDAGDGYTKDANGMVTVTPVDQREVMMKRWMPKTGPVA